MNRIANYLKTLVADANLAVSDRPCPSFHLKPSTVRTLDQPTYLRRHLVIAGVTTERRNQG